MMKPRYVKVTKTTEDKTLLVKEKYSKKAAYDLIRENRKILAINAMISIPPWK